MWSSITALCRATLNYQGLEINYWNVRYYHFMKTFTLFYINNDSKSTVVANNTHKIICTRFVCTIFFFFFCGLRPVDIIAIRGAFIMNLQIIGQLLGAEQAITWSWITYDDVIKWKHFPRYWPIVRGIHRSPLISPHKVQWRGALTFSFICVWINGGVNNRETGDLRRYLAHYDVTVMTVYMRQ